MKKIILWTAGLFKDEVSNPSSKRFIGIVSGLTLCITLFANQFTNENTAPSSTLVNAVAALSFGSLGLSSADKIFRNRGGKNA